VPKGSSRARASGQPVRSAQDQALADFTAMVPVRGQVEPRNPEQIEMRTFPQSPERTELGRYLTEDLGYRVREVDLDGLTFLSVVGTGLLLYEKAWAVPALKPQVNSFLHGSLALYRGIPVWHYHFAAAAGGTLTPHGVGPPDFNTSQSAYIPCADDADIGRVAAVSAKGSSNPGSHGGLEAMKDYREDDPDQVRGIVAKVVVSQATGDSIAIFNTGETQVRGPVACTVHRTYRQKEVEPGRFIDK
jgi:hypothetical protein